MIAPKRPRTDEGEEEVFNTIKKDTSDEIKDVDKHFYDDGDVYVISSDNWRFKVHEYHLKSISAVLRTMFDGPTRDSPAEITLTDGKIETQAVLAAFFDYLYNGELFGFGDEAWDGLPSGPVLRSINLWHFVKKYECRLAQKHLELLLEKAALSDPACNMIDVFVIGSAFDRSDICKTAIARGVGTHHWRDGTDNVYGSDLHSVVNNQDNFNLFSLPITYLELIPLRYIMAYQRARFSDQIDGETNEMIAYRFRAILRSHDSSAPMDP